MNIPTLDISLFENGTELQKTKFVSDLGLAFEEIGFVSIFNHDISDQIIDSLYTVVRNFFLLPNEIKLKYEIPDLAGQRGYTSFGREHAKGSLSPDLKEFFQFGQPLNKLSTSNLDLVPNIEVNDILDFNSLFLDIFRRFEKLGSLLLRAIALHLGLNEFYFDDYIYQGNSILRAIHYPPITKEPLSSLRAEQHEDINLITLLVGASADGLEILNKNYEWLPVTAGPGEIVVNVGDMLQRFTNDKLKSTTHRVVNPPKALWNNSRYSVPFFLHPISEMSLASLASCISSSNPKKYPDYTAGQYLDERLREIGLKK